MEQKLVSIIAPAYNHAAYIKDALNSIKEQLYQNKELIIIDDCSTDNTSVLIQEFLDGSKINECFPGGVQFIKHRKNMNAHNSLNEGIGLAKGDYISIINTDDMYEPNRLSSMVDALEREKGYLAFSKVKIMNEYGKIRSYEPFEQMFKRIESYPRISMVLSIENVSISTGNYLFHRALFDKIGGFDTKYHFIHDWDFVLRSSLYWEPVYVKETNYLYRFHDTNTIKQIDESYEMRQKKESEVYAVLFNYLKKIRDKEYSNDKMVGEDVWTYFLNQKHICYASSIWNELE